MDWDPDFPARSPIFEPLREHAAAFDARWPSLADLQSLLDRRVPPVCNAAGMRLRVMPQLRRAMAFEDRYEPRVYLRGELQSRERNWHDLFNLLAWLAFPRTKAALNERHFHSLVAQRRAGAANRGPAQDALTLLDEGGMIVASSSGDLLELIRAFEWKKLFWGRRDDVRARMRFFVLGHALYEKSLAPFSGITARAILLEATDESLRAPPAVLRAELDARAAAYIADQTALSATRDLAPIPVLGVPGWCVENERADYYDDARCFRPGRKYRGNDA